jgi:exopolyphosphatase / guanosine-5'-triphosphate,3'-diphosphate pyrophosphatase
LEPGSHKDIKSAKKRKEGLSIIDLGYNSIKVSNYGIYKNGHYKKQNQLQEYVQIGHNLFKNKNVITNQNIERTVKFLNKIKSELKQMKTNTVVPIATSAVRDADNRKDVVQSIKKNSGFEFNVLSGFEEGFFSYLGAQSVMHVPNGVFFDLGGGSIEVIYVQDYKIKKIICLDLGALRLFEKFVKLNEKLEEETGYRQLEDYVHKNLPSIHHFGFETSADAKLVGIGGTVRTVYKFISGIFQNPQSFSYDRVTMTKKMVDISNDVFKRLSQNELSQIKLIDPQRSKIITTGSCVVKILMEKLGFNDLLVCPSGLREGILENYLYLSMDKKYRLKKKFIGLNYEDLSSIWYSGNSDDFSKYGSGYPEPLYLEEQIKNFSKKLLAQRINKTKQKQIKNLNVKLNDL